MVSLSGQTGAPSLPVAGTAGTQAGMVWAGTDGSLNYVHSSGDSVALVTASAERSPATNLSISGESTGSMVTYNGTTGWANLAIGDSGEVLTSTGTAGGPVWQSAGSVLPNQLVKAWVQFNGESGGGDLIGSYNVASVSSNSAGSWTVTWDSAFTGTDYCVLVTPYMSSGIDNRVDTPILALSTGAVNIEALDDNQTRVAVKRIMVVAIGA